MNNQAIIKQSYERLNYLDIAKAIGIFLVIIGHTLGINDTPLYRTVIYSFHMPLFFIVSGIVMHTHPEQGYGIKQWWEFIKKNILRLMLPYFIFTLIYSNFSLKAVLYALYGSHDTVVFAGSPGWPSYLWYIPCLFFAKILMELILMALSKMKPLNRRIFALILSVPAFVLGFVFDLVDIEIGIPFSANLSLMGLGFMLVGYAIKGIVARFSKIKKYKQLICIVISLIAFILSLSISATGKGKDLTLYLVLMCNGDYGNPVAFLLAGFTGSAFVILISCLLDSLSKNKEPNKVKKCVLWIGRNTLGIYLLHKPILVDLFVELAKNIGLTMPSLWVSTLCAIFALAYCCGMILLIERTIPGLLGKEKVIRNRE